MIFIVGPLFFASIAGSGLLLWAVWLLRRSRMNGAHPAVSETPSVTILKPLHGTEPRLFDNLATTVEQDYAGPIELIGGVARADDPAIAAFDRLDHDRPGAAVRLVVDPTRWGHNAKVSNLVNMMAQARHEMIVLADSDMAVQRDYLTRLVAALDRPGVGAVTCLYVGRGDAGFWSWLAAIGIDLHFLPATVIGLGTGLGHPCMGSTIALRRTTLESIGGLRAFADTLADDYAIGAAVRASGGTVAVADMMLIHCCAETNARALIRQELRWNATIARIDPVGYAGSVILHPFPLALGAWMLGGSAAAVVLALAARAAVALQVARIAPYRRSLGTILATILLVPLRDLLSFGLFLASFVVRSVEWRGTGIKIGRKGRLLGRKDPSS
jgi:ceramide glucosyltransferase